MRSLPPIRDVVRDVRSGASLEPLWRDARLAIRRLIQAPMAVSAIVGTLLVGLGTFAVVYTVVQKILLDPMPYKDPDDLYFVWRDYGRIIDMNRGSLAGTDVVELQKIGGVIESAAGLRRQPGTLAVREGTDPIEIGVMFTSPNLFELVGVAPALGRGFAPGEAGPGRSPVIVLTHELWNRLGADPAIVGTNVRLNGQVYRIVGVMPASFAFVRTTESLGPPQHVDAYATFDIHLADTSPLAGSYGGLIRARRGTPLQAVTATVQAVGRTVDARDFKSRGLGLYAVGLKPDLVARVRPALVVLAFSGVFMILVLMVNLASVLLARAAQREREFAVSRALGANGAAVARAMLFEGALLGFAGGTLGALAATWGVRVLVAIAPLDLPRREAIAIDGSIVAGVVTLGIVLGLIAATAPAWWASRASLLPAAALRGSGGGRSAGRLRRTMVVAQVALSLVLLSAGALVARSLDRLLSADPGFRPAGLVTFRLPMPIALFPEMSGV